MNKTKFTKTKSKRGNRSGNHGFFGASVNKEVPPPFTPTVKSRHKFRFSTDSSVSVNITRGNLLNLLMVATSSTSTVRVIEGIRLKRVSIWTNPVIGVGSSAASPLLGAQISWIGENSPSTVISDITMGVRPASIQSRPPPSSSNRWWCMSGMQESDVLFALNIGASSVVDVLVDIRLVDEESPTAGEAPSGAVTGQMYGGYLDGIASGKLIPVGLIPIP